MQVFEKLDSLTTPDGQELALHRRGDDYFVYLAGEELMSTRQPDSERRLAELGCEDLTERRGARVLIGGLGLGFTLKAALELLPARAEVVVAEVFPQVVAWQRRYLSAVHGPLLDDPRVRVVEGDVWQLLGGEGELDAVLLDVDDGPASWCLAANGRLYEPAGLARIHRCLRPGGRLAVWSAQDDPAFVKRLRKAGFEARAVNARGHERGGVRHIVFVGQRQERGSGGRRPRAKRRPER